MSTLFVDFDGTICIDRFWRSLPRSAASNVQQYLFHEKRSIVANWMRGEYTAEAITEIVARGTGLPYDQLWQTLVNDTQTMHVPLEILDVIKKLRNVFHVVLITGNMDTFTRFTSPALRFKDHFDMVVNSYEEGQLKTDHKGESFVKYCKGKLTDAYLIEDSVLACETFAQLGGTALQVTRETPTKMHLQTLLHSHSR